ncbi:unnamed protein product, partial [Vitis vinifera]
MPLAALPQMNTHQTCLGSNHEEKLFLFSQPRRTVEAAIDENGDEDENSEGLM